MGIWKVIIPCDLVKETSSITMIPVSNCVMVDRQSIIKTVAIERYVVVLALCLYRPVARGGSGGSVEPPISGGRK